MQPTPLLRSVRIYFLLNLLIYHDHRRIGPMSHHLQLFFIFLSDPFQYVVVLTAVLTFYRAQLGVPYLLVIFSHATAHHT